TKPHINRACKEQPFHRVLYLIEYGKDNNGNHRKRERQAMVAHSSRHPDTGHHPDDSSGSESHYRKLILENNPRADKTDTGNDIRRYPVIATGTKTRGNRKCGRSKTNQHDRSKACRLIFILTLKPYQTTRQQGNTDGCQIVIFG